MRNKLLWENKDTSAIDYILLKYIDYDLDLQIFPNGDYKILDRIVNELNSKILAL